jgi:hypothetical protein
MAEQHLQQIVSALPTSSTKSVEEKMRDTDSALDADIDIDIDVRHPDIQILKIQNPSRELVAGRM